MGKVLVARINEPYEDSEALGYSYLLAFNASLEAVQIQIPKDSESSGWRRAIDTACLPSHEINETNSELLSDQEHYLMAPRSFVLLLQALAR